MSKYVILYNPISGNGNGEKAKDELVKLLADAEVRTEDVRTVKNYDEFFAGLTDETPVIVGGDGTLNYLVNHCDCDKLEKEVYYFPGGSGNDFFTDVKTEGMQLPMLLNPYIKDLPTVYVAGKSYKVLNGMGYGIDGYCCEVGDEQRAKSDKPVNYAGIAIKGLLFHYKPTNATITVDGVTREFKKAWLAPTMNGRYYGGGMNATPNQNRLDPEKKLSTLVMYKSGKIKTLLVFKNIFTGTHVKNTECVEVLEGHDITVKFDRPVAAQVDGETVLGVTEYRIVKK